MGVGGFNVVGCRHIEAKKSRSQITFLAPLRPCVEAEKKDEGQPDEYHQAWNRLSAFKVIVEWSFFE